MKKTKIMGLFTGFDDAFAAIKSLRENKLDGFTVDDVTVHSPIEHPDIDDVLGPRPVYVQKFTFLGGLFGLVFGFIFLAAAQATFLAQPQGGKPVVPLPSNIVLNYEMLILFSVLFTLVGFLYGCRLLTRKPTLYSEKVTVDQVALFLTAEDDKAQSVKDFFNKHKAVEIREEVAR